eukprot:gene841-1639_t
MSTGDKSTSEVLQSLQSKSDYYTRLTIIERKRLDDLNDAQEHIRKEIYSFRDRAKNEAIHVMNMRSAGLTPNPAYTKADGVNIGKEADLVTKKTLEILEVKLNKKLQRRSEVYNQNKVLKASINHMRRIRLQTDVSHKNLETSLLQIKDNIENIMKEATDLLEQREQTLESKELYIKQNIEEQANFEEEYERMGKFIRDQNALLEESLLHERKIDLIAEFQFQRGELTLEEEDAMAGRVGMLNNFAVSEQNSLSTIQETIHNYETMFEQLKRITNSDSLEEVMSTYSAHEEEMFSMYNYIQTQNTELETVIDATVQIQEEIKRYKQTQKEQDDQRRRIIDGLKQRLQVTLDANSHCEQRNRIHQESVDQLAKKVQSLFFKLQCDQMENGKTGTSNVKVGQKGQQAPRAESKIAILTGQTVSESNVLDFMGAIEQRAVDIIADHLRLQSRTDGGGPLSPTPGPTTPMNRWPSESIIELPEFSEEDMMGDGEDMDSKPVDLSAFKEKLQRKVAASNASKDFR